MSSLKHKTTTSLSTMVHDTAEAIADYARWPDTKGREDECDLQIRALAQVLHGFDPIIPLAITQRLIMEVFQFSDIRAMPKSGLRAALVKLGDLVDPPKK